MQSEREMTPAATLFTILTAAPEDHVWVSRRLAPGLSLLGEVSSE
jgi:hypothetical protein